MNDDWKAERQQDLTIDGERKGAESKERNVEAKTGQPMKRTGATKKNKEQKRADGEGRMLRWKEGHTKINGRNFVLNVALFVSLPVL